VLFYAVVALHFFSMLHEFSCVKRARVHLLSQNQIREIVMDSDSDEDKSYTSRESEDEEEPRPPLRYTDVRSVTWCFVLTETVLRFTTQRPIYKTSFHPSSMQTVEASTTV